MPEALVTTKRRFAKALDSLSAYSQTANPPSKPDSVRVGEKRPATASEAFDEARERASKRLRFSKSDSASTFATKKMTPSPTSSQRSAASRGPPNFSPWSHETFLARLKTFSSVTMWHPKPEAISEVEWAKRGWVCVGVNTLACKGGCEKRVVVSLTSPSKETAEQAQDAEEEDDDDEQSGFQTALVERYKDLIVTGHDEHCNWRQQGCKSDIYRLQVVRPSIWQPAMRIRYLSALAISRAIENVSLKPLTPTEQSPLSPETLLKDLHSILAPETPSDPADSTTTPASPTKALLVALHGWRASHESASDLLHCDSCFQRIGLWMYQPDYNRRPRTATTSTTTDDKPAQEEEQEATEPVTLDLLDLHREHCPWRNASTQAASGPLEGLSAAQILHRIVGTYSRDQRRRAEEKKGEEGGERQGVEGVTDGARGGSSAPSLSREEVEKADKEREGRLKRLKGLFSSKRKSKGPSPGGSK